MDPRLAPVAAIFAKNTELVVATLDGVESFLSDPRAWQAARS